MNVINSTSIAKWGILSLCECKFNLQQMTTIFIGLSLLVILVLFYLRFWHKIAECKSELQMQQIQVFTEIESVEVWNYFPKMNHQTHGVYKGTRHDESFPIYASRTEQVVSIVHTYLQFIYEICAHSLCSACLHPRQLSAHIAEQARRT